MAELFLYADQGSINVLRGDNRKVILVGGDFGYANFGDVLQLKGAIAFHNTSTPVLVYSLDSIPNPLFVETMKANFGTEALLFVSWQAVDVSQLGMQLVDKIRNVGSVHLYGGGFLNGMWGDYVLNVAEHFLKNAQGIPYFVSGQQVSQEIRERLTAHLKQYRPRLFGVRDFDSLERLKDWGLNGDYSFDDAYEPLVKLAAQVPKNKTGRVLGHLNFSSYASTGLDSRIEGTLNIFRRIHEQLPDYDLTLLNAYNDKRVVVCDTLASIVAFENDFPYNSYSVVDVASAAYSMSIDKPELLAGKLGVSCSYHITMFLHLAGIPCWLISQNAYYEQKARALNEIDNFDEYLLSPQVPDYSGRIKGREVWRDRLLSVIGESENLCMDMVFKHESSLMDPVHFFYKSSGVDDAKIQLSEIQKGKDWLEAQWRISQERLMRKDADLVELQKGKDWLEEQWRILQEQLVCKDAYLVELQKSKDWLEAQWRESENQLSCLKKSVGFRLLKKLNVIKEHIISDKT